MQKASPLEGARSALRGPSRAPTPAQPAATATPTTPPTPPMAGTPAAPLPPLESFREIELKRAQYVGPTDESNWVVPGRVMAGAYPGYDDDGLNYKSLFRLLEAGVTCFVCLQLEYDPDAREDAWRRGDAIRPYFHDAAKIARDARRPLDFVHVGIEDCAVVDDAKTVRPAQRAGVLVRLAGHVPRDARVSINNTARPSNVHLLVRRLVVPCFHRARPCSLQKVPREGAGVFPRRRPERQRWRRTPC
mgnify:CR=1 FL=1